MRRSLSLFSFLLGPIAWSNDGGLSYAGCPYLLNGHTSVRMVNERIHIDVTPNGLVADCYFVFKNTGRACTVRMGFPDWGFGANDPYEDLETSWAGAAPQSVYTSFSSTVDGAPVSVKLEKDTQVGRTWRTKYVSFRAGQTRRVRDRYTMDRSGGVVDNGVIDMATYLFHTGRSWHGTIGHTVLELTFDLPWAKLGLHPVRVAHLSPSRTPMPNVNLRTPGLVLYQGPCTAKVTGRTMRFERSNWRPSDVDDMLLFYGYDPTD